MPNFTDITPELQKVLALSPDKLQEHLVNGGPKACAALFLLAEKYNIGGEKKVEEAFGTKRSQSFTSILLTVISIAAYPIKSLQATGAAFQFLTHYAFLSRGNANLLNQSGIWKAIAENYKFMLANADAIRKHPDEAKISSDYCALVYATVQNLLMFCKT